MDNGLISSNDKEHLQAYYEKLLKIFAHYKFELQQFTTNDHIFQDKMDQKGDTKVATVVTFLECNGTDSWTV